jgi:hypothetical protein
MFDFLLFFAELALIGLIFWYVYFRKKPLYRVNGDPWGVYAGSSKHSAVHKHHHEQAGASEEKQDRAEILIKQSRKNGWVFTEQEREALQGVTGVHLEVTSSFIQAKLPPEDEQSSDSPRT